MQIRRTPSFGRALPWRWSLFAAVILATGCQSQEVAPPPGLGGPETMPVLIDCPGFTPPANGRLVGARVRLQVGRDGRPMAITPVAIRDGAVLEAAVGIAETCVFEPARQGGVPVTAWTQLAFRYREVVVES